MSEMMQVDKLVEHPRNKEFFDNIEGDRWEDFKESVGRRGIVESIVVTQDLLIVSGHQRVRACKDIGLLEIPCRISYYPDYDDIYNRTKDDMILEDLICTNIMQRGVGNVNPMKMAKCIMELERIYGIRQGSAGKVSLEPNNSALKTQKDLADQVGVKEDMLQNYKKLTTLIPELQQMVENGSMKATVGYKIWARMPQEEQEKFFEEIGREKLKTMTQKATEKYIEENNKLIKELEEEKNKPKEKEYIETVVDNTDYTIVNKLKKIEKEFEEKQTEADRLQRKLDIAVERAKIFEEDSEEYKNLKRQIEILSKEKDDISKAVSSGTELAGLIHNIEGFLKTELCPITYSRAILDMSENKTVMNNLQEIIEVVEKWCSEMRNYLPKGQQNIIINVEEN